MVGLLPLLMWERSQTKRQHSKGRACGALNKGQHLLEFCHGRLAEIGAENHQGMQKALSGVVIGEVRLESISPNRDQHHGNVKWQQVHP